MALVCLLALDVSVGGFVGMSGWLPFQAEIETSVRAADADADKQDGTW